MDKQPVPKGHVSGENAPSTTYQYPHPSDQFPTHVMVLEPYSHQVGGHSTMFRFSRRAVCKQLNNRENQFYEMIEQRHPDMLPFLPRWVSIFIQSSRIQHA